MRGVSRHAERARLKALRHLPGPVSASVEELEGAANALNVGQDMPQTAFSQPSRRRSRRHGAVKPANARARGYDCLTNYCLSTKTTLSRDVQQLTWSFAAGELNDITLAEIARLRYRLIV